MTTDSFIYSKLPKEGLLLGEGRIRTSLNPKTRTNGLHVLNESSFIQNVVVQYSGMKKV